MCSLLGKTDFILSKKPWLFYSLSSFSYTKIALRSCFNYITYCILYYIDLFTYYSIYYLKLDTGAIF